MDRAGVLRALRIGLLVMALAAPMAGWFDQADGDFARDSLALMRGAVRRDLAIASLLVVVDEGRPCRLYSALDEEQRRSLREAALQHDALPGAVRRVLERAP